MPSPFLLSAMTSLLDSPASLADAVATLCGRDPALAAAVAAGAVPGLRRREPGYAGLASVVVGQQVSIGSAAAIWGRLRVAYPDLTPQAVLSGGDEPLRRSGLSRAKMATLRAIAEAVEGGRLPLDALDLMSAEEAQDALTRVRGIGPWTADVYRLFCLGHPDAFPAGDVALQEAARLLFALPVRPDPRALAGLAERWRPLRGAAAYVLWAIYRQAKGRDVAPSL